MKFWKSFTKIFFTNSGSRNNKLVVIQREDANVGFVVVFVVDFLKIFPNIDSLQHTVFKIAKKRYGFYVRDTEILPELEISNEIKIQA